MSERVYFLSPARCSGKRSSLLFRPQANFELVLQLRTPKGAMIGDVFSFLSGLYFRGKLAYARHYGEAYVITASRGLVAPDTYVTLDDLREMGEVPIDHEESRYREPIERDLSRLLRSRRTRNAAFILLGSIATRKYVDVFLPTLGERLLFPSEFVGRGDMSRGGLLLRRVRENQPLTYVPIAGATRHGSRPPKLGPQPGAQLERISHPLLQRTACEKPFSRSR